MTNEKRQEMIAALIHERDGYVKRGMKDRAAQVDVELAKLGQKGEPPARRASKRAERTVGANA